MKSKNIRKENAKKRAPQPKNALNAIDISTDGDNYRVLYDNYKATVYRAGSDEVIAVYRAAERNWKFIPDLFSHNVKSKVEKLYF